MIDKTELRRLAEAAEGLEPADEHDLDMVGYCTSWRRAMIPFIVATPPAVLLSLLDEIEALTNKAALLSAALKKADALARKLATQMRTAYACMRATGWNRATEFDDRDTDRSIEAAAAQENYKAFSALLAPPRSRLPDGGQAMIKDRKELLELMAATISIAHPANAWAAGRANDLLTTLDEAGIVLVPQKPTPEMVEAWGSAYPARSSGDGDWTDEECATADLSAMLSASPYAKDASHD